MRAFHTSWFNFFAGFVSTFAAAPLGAYMKKADSLNLTKGNIAAQVAPAGRGGIGDTDDFLAEHLRAPSLRTDEGGQREADQAAADDETCVHGAGDACYLGCLQLLLCSGVCAGAFTGSV